MWNEASGDAFAEAERDMLKNAFCVGAAGQLSGVRL